MEKREVVISRAAVVETIAPCPPPARRRALAFGLTAIFAIFAPALFRLGQFALSSDLYSYILLIPVVSAYVLWQKRASLSASDAPNRLLAALLLFVGGALFVASLALREVSPAIARESDLSLSTTAFLVTAGGMTAWFIGRGTLATLAFPLGFLVFMIPMPEFLRTGIEGFMQEGSAVVARALFELSGTPVFYQHLSFQLPGASLHVAPECSGIRSTIALTIVSVVTGYFFLRSPFHRTALAVAVVPLALLRNGFRIFTIGELCVRVGPQMIDSWIHRRGGPVFFALSLVPFFFLVFFLQAREKAAAKAVRAD